MSTVDPHMSGLERNKHPLTISLLLLQGRVRGRERKKRHHKEHITTFGTHAAAQAKCALLSRIYCICTVLLYMSTGSEFRVVCETDGISVHDCLVYVQLISKQK